MRPDRDELELVGAAVSALRRSRSTGTAAAVRTGSGRIVTGIGLGTLCPEPVAVGAALALGEAPVALAAVRHLDADRTVVTRPCGDCRRLLREHAPGVKVLHLADGLRVAALDQLPD